jgi:hypothetical protein
VTKIFKRSITPVVAIIAEINPASAPLSLCHLLYISDAVSEKIALDTKFIINPYHPVELNVKSSTAAAISDIITDDKGP